MVNEAAGVWAHIPSSWAPGSSMLARGGWRVVGETGEDGGPCACMDVVFMMLLMTRLYCRVPTHRDNIGIAAGMSTPIKKSLAGQVRSPYPCPIEEHLLRQAFGIVGLIDTESARDISRQTLCSRDGYKYRRRRDC